MRCVSAPLTARAQLETACEVLPLPGFLPFLEKQKQINTNKSLRPQLVNKFRNLQRSA